MLLTATHRPRVSETAEFSSYKIEPCGLAGELVAVFVRTGDHGETRYDEAALARRLDQLEDTDGDTSVTRPALAELRHRKQWEAEDCC